MKVYRVGKSNLIGTKMHRDYVVGILVTPDNVDERTATAAWSYAVRYSARGLDVPDFEAAFKLVQQRHPSWQAIHDTTSDIYYQPGEAENDKPDA